MPPASSAGVTVTSASSALPLYFPSGSRTISTVKGTGTDFFPSRRSTSNLHPASVPASIFQQGCQKLKAKGTAFALLGSEIPVSRKWLPGKRQSQAQAAQGWLNSAMVVAMPTNRAPRLPPNASLPILPPRYGPLLRSSRIVLHQLHGARSKERPLTRYRRLYRGDRPPRNAGPRPRFLDRCGPGLGTTRPHADVHRLLPVPAGIRGRRRPQPGDRRPRR